MSSISRLIKEVTIPGAADVRRGAFKEATRELINLLSLPVEEAHDIEIQRSGRKIVLRVNEQRAEVDDDDVRACCKRILAIAGRFIARRDPSEEPRPLGDRASSPRDEKPASSTETSSPASERTSSPASSESNEELQKLREDNAYLRGRMDAMNEGAPAASEAGQPDYSEALGDLRRDVAALDSPLNNLQARMDALLSRSLHPLEEENQQLKQQLDTERADNAELRNLIWLADNSNASTLLENGKLRGELQRLQQALEDSESGRNELLESSRNLSEMVSQLLGEKECLEKQNQEMKAAIDVLNERNRALQQEIDRLKERGCKIVQQAQQDLDALRKLAKEMEALEAENIRYRAQIKDLTAQLNALAQKSSPDQTPELEALRKQNAELTRDSANLKRERDEAIANAITKEQELWLFFDQLRKKSLAAEESAERENQMLRTQLKQTHYRSNAENPANQLHQAELQIKALKEQTQKATAQAAAAQAENIQLRDALNAEKVRAGSLGGDNAKNSAYIRDMILANEALQNRQTTDLINLQAENDKLSAEKHELTKQVRAMRDEIANLRKQEQTLREAQRRPAPFGR